MIILQWNNPKTTITNIDLFLNNYLGENYDGLVLDGTNLNVYTKDPATAEQEEYIKQWFYTINDIPVVIEATNQYSMMFDASTVDCNVNQQVTIDYKVTNQENESYIYKYVWGGEAFGKNIEYGDWAEFFIVDVDGIMAPAGAVIKRFVKKLYASPNEKIALKAEAPAQVPVGLYLRCVYHAANTGSTRTLYVNYFIFNKG